MPVFSPIQRWLSTGLLCMAILLTVGCSGVEEVHCEDVKLPEKEQSTQELIDTFFGDYVVASLYPVLFFDILFWDNSLPVGEMPEPPDPSTLSEEKKAAAYAEEFEKRGETLLSFKEGEGYQYGCRVPAILDEVTPVVAKDLKRKLGALQVQFEAKNGKLYANYSDQAIDPSLIENTDGEADTTLTEPVVIQAENDAIAPFPVSIRLPDHVVLAGQTEMPWSTLELDAGMKVTHQEDTRTVAFIERRKLSLLTSEQWSSQDAVANPEDIQLPIVVVWLVFGALFFTFRFVFINIRAFFHAILVTTGRYDSPDDPGEVSHFQALSSALSATVGLGNISGVALAVAAGGPGAVFWMVVAALLGMSSKFTECTLGQMYRVVKEDGTVSGGPMHYLSKGLQEMRLGFLGKLLAILFAVMCIGGSFGGGNMFQANQSFEAIADVVPALKPKASGTVDFARRSGVKDAITLKEGTRLSADGADFVTTKAVVIEPGQATVSDVEVVAVNGGWDSNVSAGAIQGVKGEGDLVTVTNPAQMSGGGSWGWMYGLLLMLAVGMVIVGGIKRIGAAAGLIVPFMCGVYVLAGAYILIVNYDSVPGAFFTIVNEAFTPQAGMGGMVGVIITGFRRASFSNEAGIGSASIAHSAAATKEPVREGLVALLEPFIDTVIVCSMTGLVVVVTEAYLSGDKNGISMTSDAFATGGLSWFPIVLAGAVTLFAFSTMISWSYYGERSASWLLGDWARTPYKMLFLFCVVLGPILKISNVLDFSDFMVLGMAFPNILGLLFLSNKVGKALKSYMQRLRAGEFTKDSAAA